MLRTRRGPKSRGAMGMPRGVARVCLYLLKRNREDGVSTTTTADEGTERGMYKRCPKIKVIKIYRKFVVFVVGPARPRTQHDYHHDTKVKPEAATAVIELLMLGGKTPETC
jgi:hypothetical protein